MAISNWVESDTAKKGPLYQPHSMTKQILSGFSLETTCAILRYFSIT